MIVCNLWEEEDKKRVGPRMRKEGWRWLKLNFNVMTIHNMQCIDIRVERVIHSEMVNVFFCT